MTADEPPGAQTAAVGVAAGVAALGNRDQALDERPQLLRTRNGGLEVLVLDERMGLVAEHRDAMIRHAAEFPMRLAVSHKVPYSARAG